MQRVAMRPENDLACSTRYLYSTSEKSDRVAASAMVTTLPGSRTGQGLTRMPLKAVKTLAFKPMVIPSVSITIAAKAGSRRTERIAYCRSCQVPSSHGANHTARESSRARLTFPRIRALRSTESRRSTVNDTPILLGIHRPIGDILELLGAA